MRDFLLPGAEVELVAPLAGYEAGARGTILRYAGGGGTVLVRFADTGHALFVPRDGIRLADADSTPRPGL
jgi:hypothetical protein